MKRISIFLCLVLLVGCFVPSEDIVTPDNPVPVIKIEFGFDSTVPQAMRGHRKEALRLAAVADEYARQLKYDGTLDKPAISTTTGVQQTFKSVLSHMYQGKPAVTKKAATILNDVLEKELQPDGKGHDLTPELRDKAVRIFRSYAAALRETKSES